MENTVWANISYLTLWEALSSLQGLGTLSYRQLHLPGTFAIGFPDLFVNSQKREG